MASETPPSPDRRVVRWPDGAQWARQLAVVAFVLVAWSGLFYGAMRLPTGSDDRAAAADAHRDQRRAAGAARADSTGSVQAPDPVAADAAPAAAGAGPETWEAPPSPEPVRTAEADAPPPAAASTPRPGAAAATPAPTATPEPPPAVPPRAEPSRTAAGTPPAADVPMEELTLDPLDDAVAAGEELGEVSFAADVLPVFERRCIKCHGGLRDDGTPRLEEGLSLLTVADVLAGSTWGPVVEPGDVAGSYLYELVENGDMPDNEPRLLPRELRVIAAWIRAGAPNN